VIQVHGDLTFFYRRAIAPFIIMTAPRKVGRYDVFISHCGEDCKENFADLLRDDLERVGVQCFFDEHSLEVGKVAADEMLKAMEEATYGIVFLSPGFFEREWCVKELETFARRGRIVPVFLGDFAAIQAAAKAAVAKGAWKEFGHFEWSEEGYQLLVRENTKFVGVRLAEKGWWRTCIRRVRDEVLRLLGKVGGGIRISEDELLVGQEEHLKELKRLVGLPQEGVVGTGGTQAAGEVGIVGVKGMGGSARLPWQRSCSTSQTCASGSVGAFVGWRWGRTPMATRSLKSSGKFSGS
jgi:hypothetical protein